MGILMVMAIPEAFRSIGFCDRAQKYAFYGHHKCATHFFSSLLKDACSHLKLHPVVAYHPDVFQWDLPRFLLENRVDFLIYTNAQIQHVRQLSEVRGFHVVRDPRDVLVSAYFSHLYSHPTVNWPELVEHRERLKTVSKSEGLLMEMEFSRFIFEAMFAWDYNQPHVLELHWEDIIDNPAKGMIRIFKFLDLLKKSPFEECLAFSIMRPEGKHFRNIKYRLENCLKKRISPDHINRIVHANRFEAHAKGRSPGEEKNTDHYRKGVSGDWVNHFKEVHVSCFNEKYNHVLLKLGYGGEE